MPTWLECPQCKGFFAAERPSRVDGCCSKRCARKLEAAGRRPTREEAIARVLAAIKIELEKFMK